MDPVDSEIAKTQEEKKRLEQQLASVTSDTDAMDNEVDPETDADLGFRKRSLSRSISQEDGAAKKAKTSDGRITTRTANSKGPVEISDSKKLAILRVTSRLLHLLTDTYKKSLAITDEIEEMERLLELKETAAVRNMLSDAYKKRKAITDEIQEIKEQIKSTKVAAGENSSEDEDEGENSSVDEDE